MNIFSNQYRQNKNWLWSMSLMSALLGFMMMMAWVTRESRTTRIDSTDADQQNRVLKGSIDIQEQYLKVSEEVKRLRADKTKLEEALAKNDNGSKTLNDSLQEAKMLACLTELEGPGLVVTLRDSQKPTAIPSDAAIHDLDVLRTVNELWNAGAEGIAVNGQRVTTNSSIRCVGSTILVNDIKIAPPVRIEAIGDGKTLSGAMSLPEGVLDVMRRLDPAMVNIELAEKLRLPAFAGSTTRKWGTVPKETPK
ncbi:MAG: DUF881 domain-containing protein [Armatimonadetes bacterium]|nr:DUF881 domain-containing protein [Armatimonadota bacterium]